MDLREKEEEWELGVLFKELLGEFKGVLAALEEALLGDRRKLTEQLLAWD